MFWIETSLLFTCLFFKQFYILCIRNITFYNNNLSAFPRRTKMEVMNLRDFSLMFHPLVIHLHSSIICPCTILYYWIWLWIFAKMLMTQCSPFMHEYLPKQEHPKWTTSWDYNLVNYLVDKFIIHVIEELL